MPIWGGKNWLNALSFDASYDVDDLLPAIRSGLSVDGKLYAAPFYGESSMIMYRKDLVAKAGMTMPQQPTWGEVYDIAKAITEGNDGVYGACLRGKQVGVKVVLSLQQLLIRLVEDGLMKTGNHKWMVLNGMQQYHFT